MADEYFGSSGTLVSAIFETAGYHYQSIILDAFTKPFQTGVGAFIFVVGMMVAIVSLVLTGRYKFLAWFLLGPAIFLAMITERKETKGSAWKYADEQRDEIKKQFGVDKILERSKKSSGVADPKVSTFFARYNNFVSGSIQSVVKSLQGKKKQEDLKFIFDREAFARLHESNIDDYKFKELLNGSLLRDCLPIVEQARQKGMAIKVEDQSGASPETTAMKDQAQSIERLLSQRNITRLTVGAADYIANIKFFYRPIYDEILNLGKAPTTSNMFDNILKSVDSTLKSKTPANVEEISKTKEELLRNPTAFSCVQIWALAYQELYRFANRVIGAELDKAEYNGIDREAFKEELKSMFKLKNGGGPLDNDSDTQMAKVVAKYVLRNEINKDNSARTVFDSITQATQARGLFVGGDTDLDSTERARNANREWSERTRVMNTATNIPYYQGLGLFLLSATFPFFCLLLIAPGKHGGFLLWFVLWFWFKSWDIGYAVVIMLDDLMFSLFSFNQPAAKSLDSDLSKALAYLFERDPTFNLTTYFGVIGTCLNAIPVISSMLVLGTLRGGEGLISSGMKIFSNLSTERAMYYQANKNTINRMRGFQQAALTAASQLSRQAIAGNLNLGQMQRSFGGGLDNGVKRTGASGDGSLKSLAENVNRNAFRSGITGGALASTPYHDLSKLGSDIIKNADSLKIIGPLAAPLPGGGGSKEEKRKEEYALKAFRGGLEATNRFSTFQMERNIELFNKTHEMVINYAPFIVNYSSVGFETARGGRLEKMLGVPVGTAFSANYDRELKLEFAKYKIEKIEQPALTVSLLTGGNATSVTLTAATLALLNVDKMSFSGFSRVMDLSQLLNVVSTPLGRVFPGKADFENIQNFLATIDLKDANIAAALDAIANADYSKATQLISQVSDPKAQEFLSRFAGNAASKKLRMFNNAMEAMGGYVPQPIKDVGSWTLDKLWLKDIGGALNEGIKGGIAQLPPAARGGTEAIWNEAARTLGAEKPVQVDPLANFTISKEAMETAEKLIPPEILQDIKDILDIDNGTDNSHPLIPGSSCPPTSMENSNLSRMGTELAMGRTELPNDFSQITQSQTGVTVTANEGVTGFGEQDNSSNAPANQSLNRLSMIESNITLIRTDEINDALNQANNVIASSGGNAEMHRLVERLRTELGQREQSSGKEGFGIAQATRVPDVGRFEGIRVASESSGYGDNIFMSPGNDRLIGGAGNDQIEIPGQNSSTLQQSVDYTSRGTPEEVAGMKLNLGTTYQTPDIDGFNAGYFSSMLVPDQVNNSVAPSNAIAEFYQGNNLSGISTGSELGSYLNQVSNTSNNDDRFVQNSSGTDATNLRETFNLTGQNNGGSTSESIYSRSAIPAFEGAKSDIYQASPDLYKGSSTGSSTFNQESFVVNTSDLSSSNFGKGDLSFQSGDKEGLGIAQATRESDLGRFEGIRATSDSNVFGNNQILGGAGNDRIELPGQSTFTVPQSVDSFSRVAPQQETGSVKLDFGTYQAPDYGGVVNNTYFSSIQTPQTQERESILGNIPNPFVENPTTPGSGQAGAAGTAFGQVFGSIAEEGSRGGFFENDKLAAGLQNRDPMSSGSSFNTPNTPQQQSTGGVFEPEKFTNTESFRGSEQKEGLGSNFGSDFGSNFGSNFGSGFGSSFGMEKSEQNWGGATSTPSQSPFENSGVFSPQSESRSAENIQYSPSRVDLQPTSGLPFNPFVITVQDILKLGENISGSLNPGAGGLELPVSTEAFSPISQASTSEVLTPAKAGEDSRWFGNDNSSSNFFETAKEQNSGTNSSIFTPVSAVTADNNLGTTSSIYTTADNSLGASSSVYTPVDKPNLTSGGSAFEPVGASLSADPFQTQPQGFDSFSRQPMFGATLDEEQKWRSSVFGVESDANLLGVVSTVFSPTKLQEDGTKEVKEFLLFERALESYSRDATISELREAINTASISVAMDKGSVEMLRMIDVIRQELHSRLEREDKLSRLV